MARVGEGLLRFEKLAAERLEPRAKLDERGIHIFMVVLAWDRISLAAV